MYKNFQIFPQIKITLQYQAKLIKTFKKKKKSHANIVQISFHSISRHESSKYSTNNVEHARWLSRPMIRFSWKSINQRPIVRRIERKSTRVDTRSLVSCFRLKKQVMANSILSRRRHESWTNWERRYWESINPLIINHDSWIVIRLLSSKYQLVPIGNFFVAIYLLKLNENEEWNVIWKRNCFPFNSWFDIVYLSFIFY